MEEKMKKCSKCGIIKNITDFRKSKKGKYGVMSVCKICQSNIELEYRLKNPNKSKEANKKSYEKNKEKYINIRKKYYTDNLPKLKEYWKNYRDEHVEKRKEYSKEYRKINKDKIDIKKKEYAKNNRNVINKYNRSYRKKYYSNNPQLEIWRSILKRTIKYFNSKKTSTTIELLKYSPKELKQRIECQFKEGMSWDNYGKWHVDHKKPISLFNKNTSPHIVNALSNLQPLWAKDNLSKGKRLLN